MNIDVYDTANTTHLGTLTERYRVGFLDQDGDVGAGSFRVDVASTADLALLQPRRVVRFRAGATPGDGDMFAALVQDRPAALSADIEPSAGDTIATVQYDCPGLLSWLGYEQGGATLWPYGGLDGRQQQPRMFGWFAPDFDDSGWGDVSGALIGGRLSTEGWPDPSAVAFVPVFPGGRALYRRYMPPAVDAAGPARIHLAASAMSQVTVWLDSDIVIEKPAGATGLFTVDAPYEDIEHLVAIEVVGGPGRVGLSWIKLDVTTDGDGNETFTLGSVLRRTFDPVEFPDADSDWFSFETEDPAEAYPGVTVGYVADVALTEDAARHTRPWTWGFDGAVDSDGQPWTVEFSRGFRAGEVGRLFDELASIEGSPHITPDGQVRLAVSRGADRTGTVTVEAPYDLDLSGRGPQATRWIYETSRGFGTIVNDAAETELGVVMEQFVQLGTDIDPAAIAPALVAQLAADGVTIDEIEVELPDDVTPYVDVHLGDRVMCDARDGQVAVRLRSFEYEEGDAGEDIWRATAEPV